MSAGTAPLHPGGQAAPSRLPRVAAAIVLAMALTLWADVFFRTRLAGVIGSSGYSTIAGLVISAVTLPVAAGVWFRLGWAWWAGLIAAAWQLISHLLYIVVTSATGAITSYPSSGMLPIIQIRSPCSRVSSTIVWMNMMIAR